MYAQDLNITSSKILDSFKNKNDKKSNKKKI